MGWEYQAIGQAVQPRAQAHGLGVIGIESTMTSEYRGQYERTGRLAKDTDQELVRRVKSGDRQAFDLLFSRYQHKILNLISRYVRDAQEVEDVAQEAFIKAFRALPRFRGESAFYTWLYRIAINTAKNHLVARSRRPPGVDVDVEDAQFLDGADQLRQGENPEAELSRDQLSTVIDEAISALPDDLRSAVTLREFDGLSYEQIADIMECPVGTVRSRIFRAREAIDERIRPFLGKETR
jgi:RNA polymerase sigma-70 factor (ECF subfamily)|tara:strand:- start:222 stop:935 length:714 start_codon:yes stop_codon:yes gene_type:complete